jgi:Flp pilus assembly protein TadB
LILEEEEEEEEEEEIARLQAYFAPLHKWNKRTNWALAAIFATALIVVLTPWPWTLISVAVFLIAMGVFIYCRVQWGHAVDDSLDSLFNEETK